MMIVEEVKKSISRSALSGSMVTKYYYNRAPQNTSYPYVTYYIISDIYREYDTGTKYSDVIVQFNIYDNNNDYGKRTNDIMNEIVDFYDLAKDKLVVSGSTVINSRRDYVLAPRATENNDWQGVIQYTLHLENR